MQPFRLIGRTAENLTGPRISRVGLELGAKEVHNLDVKGRVQFCDKSVLAGSLDAFPNGHPRFGVPVGFYLFGEAFTEVFEKAIFVIAHGGPAERIHLALADY